MVQQIEVKVAKFPLLFMFSKELVNKALGEILIPPLSSNVIKKCGTITFSLEPRYYVKTSSKIKPIQHTTFLDISAIFQDIES